MINEGLLPTTFKGINANHSAYSIILRRSGSSPNYVIDGLITTTTQWKEGDKVRYDLLGKAMQAAGVDSGVSKNASTVSGYSGQWSEQTSNYKNITASGLLAYRVGYSSAMYSVYLRRDGTLPMTGSLNMDGKDINNARDINAKGELHVGGYTNISGDIRLEKNLAVTGDSTFEGNITAKKAITSTGNIISGGRLTTSEFLQIKGLAVAGSSCTGNGLQSVSSTGQLLSCVSGIWKDAEGYVGGIYSLSGTVCARNNAVTNSCSCPVGFLSSQILSTTEPYTVSECTTKPVQTCKTYHGHGDWWEECTTKNVQVCSDVQKNRPVSLYICSKN